MSFVFIININIFHVVTLKFIKMFYENIRNPITRLYIYPSSMKMSSKSLPMQDLFVTRMFLTLGLARRFGRLARWAGLMRRRS